ncbi:hypothetical protein AAEU32_11095 [Pseudoalteromonas sp. SSDWG2]|uniref:hypothetical protein n=1 Tax=Pseudoalteromonas sp. SSDWG2 TaxID=3139391 RepID=UPI003BA99C0D
MTSVRIKKVTSELAKMLAASPYKLPANTNLDSPKDLERLLARLFEIERYLITKKEKTGELSVLRKHTADILLLLDGFDLRARNKEAKEAA